MCVNTANPQSTSSLTDQDRSQIDQHRFLIALIRESCRATKCFLQNVPFVEGIESRPATKREYVSRGLYSLVGGLWFVTLHIVNAYIHDRAFLLNNVCRKRYR